MNHAPGAGSIARPADRVKLLHHECLPPPVTYKNMLSYVHMTAKVCLIVLKITRQIAEH